MKSEGTGKEHILILILLYGDVVVMRISKTRKHELFNELL